MYLRKPEPEPTMYLIYGHRYISPTTVIILITLFVFSTFSLASSDENQFNEELNEGLDVEEFEDEVSSDEDEILKEENVKEDNWNNYDGEINLQYFDEEIAEDSSLYRGRHQYEETIGSANDWDILIFTQNWPSSVCDKWTHEGKGHSCFRYPNNTWTIHGLWPTKYGTIGPAFCDKSRPFSPEAIYGIEDDLLKYWTPVQKNKKRYTFWAHEWEKHGTCTAGVLPGISSEFDYFYSVLQLFKKYEIGSVLEKAGIISGKSYNVTQIWDGVKNVLSKNPQVVCYDAKGNVSELIEIRICFDKSFNLVDCDGTVVGSNLNRDFNSERYHPRRKSGYHNLTNCRTEVPVTIPKGPSQVSLQTPPTPEETKLEPKPSILLERLKQLHFTQWFTG